MPSQLKSRIYTTKIIILTTEGDSREDGNVYYATHLLVSSDTLKFDENVFTSDVITVDTIPWLADEMDENEVDHDKLIKHIQGLGYTVERPDAVVIATS